MIDGGAPYISLAQAEFERLAVYWQEKAQEAAATAAHYTALAQAMRNVYQHTMKDHCR